MSKENYSFLTSNQKKAEDFKFYGFGVKSFDTEVKEVKCPHTDIIALYKAKDTGLNNIIVEDTGLFVADAPFCGTEIKYVYENIKDDARYEGVTSVWTVAICVKTETEFLVAMGKTEGVLRYPGLPDGYHFESIFAVQDGNTEKRFCELTMDERVVHGPRYKALDKLRHALDTGDYSQLMRVSEKNLPTWKGTYQEDEFEAPKVKQRARM